MNYIFKAKNKQTGEVREFGILELSVQRIYFMCGEKNINFTEDKFNSEWEVVDITGTNPVEESLKKTFEDLPTQSIEDKKTMNKEDIIEEMFEIKNGFYPSSENTTKRFSVKEISQKLSDLEQSTREKLMSEQGANSMCEYWYKKSKEDTLQEVKEKIKKLEADYDAFDTPYEVLEQLLTSLQRNDSK